MWLFLSSLAGISSFYLFKYFPFAISLLLIAIIVFSLIRKRFILIALILISFFYAYSRDHPIAEPFRCDDALIKGYVVDMPAGTAIGFSAPVRIIDIDNCAVDIRGRQIKMFSSGSLEAGAEGVFLVDIKGRRRFFNPSSFRHDVQISASLKEVYSLKVKKDIMWYVQRSRAALISFFRKEFSQDVAGFLGAIVTGDRSGVSADMRKSFASSGLAHLLAVSGVHFGIFSFLVFSVFRFILKRLPYPVLNRMTLYITPSGLSALLSLPFMTFYLFLSGAGIPAIRSFIMINVFLFGMLLGKKGMWKNSVALAAFILLVISPDAVFDVSFLLSFTAVVSIGYALEWNNEKSNELFIPGMKELFRDRIWRWTTVTFIISVAAYVGTMPLVLYFFHSVSLVSPVTNMVISPVVCFLIIPGAVLGSFVYLLTGMFPLTSILQVLCHAVLQWIYGLGTIDFIRFPVPAFPVILSVIFYACLSLLIFLRKKRYGAVLSLLCLAIILVYPFIKGGDDFQVTFLDVGQAESAVIVLPDKKVVVIDTGKDGRQTAGYLDYLGIDKIDALVLSHSGNDHAGGVWYITGMKETEMLFDNGMIIYPGPVPSGITHRALKRGDIIEGDGYTIEILHPYKGFYTAYSSKASEENNESLVLKVKARGMSVLFTGDIESEAEDNMVHLGGYLKSDVLKVPHHGSKTSSTPGFLSAVNPSVAVISSGMFNPYGHPHAQTLARLKDVRTFNTARDGAVKIELSSPGGGAGDGGHRIELKTFEQYRFKTAHNFSEEVGNFYRMFQTW
ncbi:comEC family competence protein [bacterium BMS3Abin07]|nr:comEC family competence protein [bacterium BMS3Abin07]